MEANGYRVGDIRRPDADSTFYIFDYDWRRGTVESAQALAAALERLRRARGETTLTVDLVCQSSAARIARYYLRYGAASLERAERGQASPPASVRVRRLVLVGTANGGSIRVLREMNRGRRYVVFGRKLEPETFFTYRSLYEALPSPGTGLFVDRQGRPLDVDLFDPRAWETYGWSIFNERARTRADRREDLFGDTAGRRRFLTDMLDRARRLHALLARDSAAVGEVAYYLIQNEARPTPTGAVLFREKDGEWRTAFADERPVRREPMLLSRVEGPGDGHATVESQWALSPGERQAVREATSRIPGTHYGIIFEPDAQRRIVEILTAPR
jgi:hypothetical protein